MEGEKGMKKSLLLETSLEAIENRFTNLMEREEAQRKQYRSEKAQLESEVEELKAAGERKEKIFKKLQVDSEVRWHRDKYKMLLNDYEKYYKNVEKMITEKEKKIAELDYLLELLGD